MYVETDKVHYFNLFLLSVEYEEDRLIYFSLFLLLYFLFYFESDSHILKLIFLF